MTDEIKPGYTRISDVLRPFNRFDGIDPNVLANAADRGTRVHEYCNMYVRNVFLPSIEDDCEGYLESFSDWYRLSGVKAVHTEKRVYDDDLKITGQFDMVVRFPNTDELTLIDIKTPQTASRSWALQLSAYAMLIQKELNLKISRRIIVQLSKKGTKPKIIEYQDHEKDENLFLSALNLYRHFEK